MNYLYGFYTLDMDELDYNTLLNNLITRLITTAPLGGYPITDYEEYQNGAKEGYAILGVGSEPKGIGFKTPEHDRVWIIEDGDVYKLFIDAKPDIIRHLDFTYLSTNKEVIWNLNGQVTIKHFA